MATSHKATAFLSLPGEIRDLIYQHALDYKRIITLIPRPKTSKKLSPIRPKEPLGTGLLFACRQTYNESITYLVDRDRVDFACRSHHIVWFFESIPKQLKDGILRVSFDYSVFTELAKDHWDRRRVAPEPAYFWRYMLSESGVGEVTATLHSDFERLRKRYASRLSYVQRALEGSMAKEAERWQEFLHVTDTRFGDILDTTFEALPPLFGLNSGKIRFVFPPVFRRPKGTGSFAGYAEAWRQRRGHERIPSFRRRTDEKDSSWSERLRALEHVQNLTMIREPTTIPDLRDTVFEIGFEPDILTVNTYLTGEPPVQEPHAQELGHLIDLRLLRLY